MRFVSAQLEAYLENDAWLETARRSNALARAMADKLTAKAGAVLAAPVEANALFAWLPDATVARLLAAGARFYEWAPSHNGLTMIRLVLSFATPQADIDRFVKVASS